jgi:enolase-phosphatase E1
MPSRPNKPKSRLTKKKRPGKRNAGPSATRIILLDIEGTTTPPEYVHDVVYPFLLENMRDFMLRHEEDPTIGADVESLRKQYLTEDQDDPDLPVWNKHMPINSSVGYMGWLMLKSNSPTALKALQGRILAEAYAKGHLRGAVYPDVRPALERWVRQTRANCIFSSGSVIEQRLLFANSTAGDLSPFLRAYFDTLVGEKKETKSYRRIAQELGTAAREVLFVSDVAAELHAARAAGMETVLCIRGGTHLTGSWDGRKVRSFDEIFP